MGAACGGDPRHGTAFSWPTRPHGGIVSLTIAFTGTEHNKARREGHTRRMHDRDR